MPTTTTTSRNPELLAILRRTCGADSAITARSVLAAAGEDVALHTYLRRIGATGHSGHLVVGQLLSALVGEGDGLGGTLTLERASRKAKVYSLRSA